MERVSINDASADSGNKSLSDQHQQQIKDGNDFDTAAQKARDAAGGEPSQSTEEARPSWLPEKFKNVDEFVKSHAELEKKLGTPSGDNDQQKNTTDSKADESTGSLDAVIKSASEEFAKEGKLSDGTYETLQKAGVSREYVDAYLAGHEVLTAQHQQELFDSVGGKESYESMTKWMGENLTDDELSAYNATMEGGNVGAIKLAISGMDARYKAAGGHHTEPNLEQGSTSAGPRGAVPYTSYDEVRADMGKAEYQNSPAFRAQVAKRLAASNL